MNLRLFTRGYRSVCTLLVIWTLVIAAGANHVAAESLPSCTAQVSSSFVSGFSPGDFDVVNVLADGNGTFSLATGFQAIDPNRIVIPFDQNVWASFFYEDAGYTSTLGWMLYNDAVDVNGNFLGWSNIPASKKHPIIGRVRDGSGGGNGILELAFANATTFREPTSEAELSVFNDPHGEGKFVVDGDGVVTPKDMRKSLGTFAAGTEIVFWLANDTGDWGQTRGNNIFYTKKDWNPDIYNRCVPPAGDPRWLNANEFYRTYLLGTANAGGTDCTMSKGFLDPGAITRLSSVFGLTMNGNYNLTVRNNGKFPHVIVAAPQNSPNQWILSWEDLFNGGDMDYNDITFRIERKTGGAIEVKDAAAIRPSAAESFYTSVTFGVYDTIPGGACSGQTGIDYFVSIDNGLNWLEVRQGEWNTVQEYRVETDGSKTLLGTQTTGASWTPGTPAQTYRTRRLDFAGANLVGRELVWKAYLKSELESCVPQVVGATLSGDTQSNDIISRGSPIKLANLLYTGSYETPALSWADKTLLRGHLRATRLYHPSYPDVATTPLSLQPVNVTLWDAGQRLQSVLPENRTVYFPNITTQTVAGESLTLTTDGGAAVSVADGATTVYSGTLANAPLLATTIRIAAGSLLGTLVFHDEGTDLLRSDAGYGTINRFTGEFQLTFNTPPAAGVPFVAAYSWYSTTATPRAFTAANVTNAMLAIDATPIVPTGYKFDFDGNGSFTEQDGDWLVDWVRGYADGRYRTKQKSWKLGPIDHSIPALMTPPGIPEWYFGTAISKELRTSYKAFTEAQKNRDTVLFVGSRSGMLHAFDAGKFRYGDNPLTSTVKEVEGRGYFLWEDLAPIDGIREPNYGTGNELWSFIPANLMPRLKNNRLQGDDQAYVDASPTLAQVYIADEWKTVVLSAEGNGGDSIFCLDVTDPANPKFLWEFADPDLFRSRSSPAVGQIGLLMVNGQPKWTAFFVSGKSSANSYPSVYAIDISNGSVIRRIFLDSDATALGGVPSGQPAILDTDDNGYIDRLYVSSVSTVVEGGVTREKGFLHKVNLPDDPLVFWSEASIGNLVVNSDFIDDDGTTDVFGNPAPLPVPDAQRWHPIYASPTVVVDDIYHADNNSRERLVRIFFGTGDSPYHDENINTANTRYHFFAYTDRAPKRSVDPVSSMDPAQVTLDWFYELPAGQRIFASAFASAGKIYFGTSSSETENPCDGGNQGELFAFSLTGYDHANPPTPWMRRATGDIVSSPLVDDRQAYFISNSRVSEVGGGKYNNALQNKGFGEAKPSSWREILD